MRIGTVFFNTRNWDNTRNFEKYENSDRLYGHGDAKRSFIV
jgi:hypothetical protein